MFDQTNVAQGSFPLVITVNMPAVIITQKEYDNLKLGTPGTVTITIERLKDLQTTEEAYRELLTRISEVPIVDRSSVSIKQEQIPNDSYDRPCKNPSCKRMVHKHNTSGYCSETECVKMHEQQRHQAKAVEP